MCREGGCSGQRTLYIILKELMKSKQTKDACEEKEKDI